MAAKLEWGVGEAVGGDHSFQGCNREESELGL